VGPILVNRVCREALDQFYKLLFLIKGHEMILPTGIVLSVKNGADKDLVWVKATDLNVYMIGVQDRLTEYGWAPKVGTAVVFI
jgi:hypothetical protein